MIYKYENINVIVKILILFDYTGNKRKNETIMKSLGLLAEFKSIQDDAYANEHGYIVINRQPSNNKSLQIATSIFYENDYFPVFHL